MLDRFGGGVPKAPEEDTAKEARLVVVAAAGARSGAG